MDIVTGKIQDQSTRAVSRTVALKSLRSLREGVVSSRHAFIADQQGAGPAPHPERGCRSQMQIPRLQPRRAVSGKDSKRYSRGRRSLRTRSGTPGIRHGKEAPTSMRLRGGSRWHRGRATEGQHWLASSLERGGKTPYQASQNRKSRRDQGHKSQSNDNRRVCGALLKYVVNLRLLAVSVSVDGRHRHVGVALDNQLEGRAIVRLGTAECTDDDAGIKRT